MRLKIFRGDPDQERDEVIMFEYRAELIRVIDGDTVVMSLDLGFKTFVVRTLRLLDIDAPEVRGKRLDPQQRLKGAESTDHLRSLLASYVPLTVRSQKDKTGKYGRYLATIMGMDEHGDVFSINDQMVSDGHAVFKSW
jgi:micrococcal nuclease